MGMNAGASLLPDYCLVKGFEQPGEKQGTNLKGASLARVAGLCGVCLAVRDRAGLSLRRPILHQHEENLPPPFLVLVKEHADPQIIEPGAGSTEVSSTVSLLPDGCPLAPLEVTPENGLAVVAGITQMQAFETCVGCLAARAAQGLPLHQPLFLEELPAYDHPYLVEVNG